MNSSIRIESIRAEPNEGSYLELMFQEKFGSSDKSLEGSFSRSSDSSGSEIPKNSSSSRGSIRRSCKPRRQVPSSGMKIVSGPGPRLSGSTRNHNLQGTLKRTRRQSSFDSKKTAGLPPRKDSRGRNSTKKTKNERRTTKQGLKARGMQDISNPSSCSDRCGEPRPASALCGVDKILMLPQAALYEVQQRSNSKIASCPKVPTPMPTKCVSERHLKQRTSGQPLRRIQSLPTCNENVKDSEFKKSVPKRKLRMRQRSIVKDLPDLQSFVGQDKASSTSAHSAHGRRRERSCVLPKETKVGPVIPWIAQLGPKSKFEQFD